MYQSHIVMWTITDPCLLRTKHNRPSSENMGVYIENIQCPTVTPMDGTIVFETTLYCLIALSNGSTKYKKLKKCGYLNYGDIYCFSYQFGLQCMEVVICGYHLPTNCCSAEWGTFQNCERFDDFWKVFRKYVFFFTF